MLVYNPTINYDSQHVLVCADDRWIETYFSRSTRRYIRLASVNMFCIVTVVTLLSLYYYCRKNLFVNYCMTEP